MAPGDRRDRLVRRAARAAGLALAVVLAMGVAAWAQYPTPLIFGRSLSTNDEDLAVVRAATAPLFDAATSGMTREWSNPQTGNSGTVELRRIFALRGMPCRTFGYTTWTEHHANETQIVLDWCKLSDGWKLVDPREPAVGPAAK
jgi:hypothetical protein